jgi:integration host factor subunit beta
MFLMATKGQNINRIGYGPLQKKYDIEKGITETIMNKSELVDAIAQEMDMNPKDATSVVNTILDSMCNTLIGGNTIEIRGFGSFVIKDYESYRGRNPKTGENIEVPPKKLPFFKVGKELREKVNRRTQ